MDAQLISETSQHEFNETLDTWLERGYKPQGQLVTCPCKVYSEFTGDAVDAIKYSILVVKE